MNPVDDDNARTSDAEPEERSESAGALEVLSTIIKEHPLWTLIGAAVVVAGAVFTFTSEYLDNRHAAELSESQREVERLESLMGDFSISATTQAIEVSRDEIVVDRRSNRTRIDSTFQQVDDTDIYSSTLEDLNEWKLKRTNAFELDAYYSDMSVDEMLSMRDVPETEIERRTRHPVYRWASPYYVVLEQPPIEEGGEPAGLPRRVALEASIQPVSLADNAQELEDYVNGAAPFDTDTIQNTVIPAALDALEDDPVLSNFNRFLHGASDWVTIPWQRSRLNAVVIESNWAYAESHETFAGWTLVESTWPDLPHSRVGEVVTLTEVSYYMVIVAGAMLYTIDIRVPTLDFTNSADFGEAGKWLAGLRIAE